MRLHLKNRVGRATFFKPHVPGMYHFIAPPHYSLQLLTREALPSPHLTDEEAAVGRGSQLAQNLTQVCSKAGTQLQEAHQSQEPFSYLFPPGDPAFPALTPWVPPVPNPLASFLHGKNAGGENEESLSQVPNHWAFGIGLKTLWGWFYCPCSCRRLEILT